MTLTEPGRNTSTVDSLFLGSPPVGEASSEESPPVPEVSPEMSPPGLVSFGLPETFRGSSSVALGAAVCATGLAAAGAGLAPRLPGPPLVLARRAESPTAGGVDAPSEDAEDVGAVPAGRLTSPARGFSPESPGLLSVSRLVAATSRLSPGESWATAGPGLFVLTGSLAPMGLLVGSGLLVVAGLLVLTGLLVEGARGAALTTTKGSSSSPSRASADVLPEAVEPPFVDCPSLTDAGLPVRVSSTDEGPAVRDDVSPEANGWPVLDVDGLPPEAVGLFVPAGGFGASERLNAAKGEAASGTSTDLIGTSTGLAGVPGFFGGAAELPGLPEEVPEVGRFSGESDGRAENHASDRQVEDFSSSAGSSPADVDSAGTVGTGRVSSDR